MVRKRTIKSSNVDEKNIQELYAAWGTTREEHLTQMLKLIEEEKENAQRLLNQRRDEVEELGVSMRAAENLTADRKAAAKSKRHYGKFVINRLAASTGSGKTFRYSSLIVSKADDAVPERGGVVRFYFEQPRKERMLDLATKKMVNKIAKKTAKNAAKGLSDIKGLKKLKGGPNGGGFSGGPKG